MAGKTKKAMIIIAAALAVLAAALCLRAFRAHAFDPDAVSVPILMYHSVCPDESLAGRYIVTDSTFREDMEYLKTKGYTAVFVSDLIDYVYDGTPLPAKPVIVTLDDGYLNNLEYVLPILRETGMKAEISVVGAYSGNPGAEREKNIAYSHLDWDEIKTLSDSGYAEIGNHTWDMHGESAGGRRGCKKLPGESAEEYGAAFAGDLEKLQTALEEKTGKTPEVFTYPYGKISPQAEEVLKKLSFRAALTCRPGVNHIVRDPEQLYALRRFNRPSGLGTGTFMALCGIK